MMSYWNETLQNINQDQRREKFIFSVNKRKFEVPLSYALGISSFISEQYLKDPSFRSFEIEDKEKIEEEFSNFIQGKEIKEETFIKFGKILKNQEMIKKWKNSFELTNKGVINYLNSCYEIKNKSNPKNQGFKDYEDIKTELEYLINHFEEMKDDIKDLNDNILIYLLRSENLLVKNEDIIWDTIKGRIKDLNKEINKNDIKKNLKERNQKARRFLLNAIHIKCLNKTNFKEYIEEIKSEDISEIDTDEKGTIWNQIQ